MPLPKTDIVAMIMKLPPCPSCGQPCTAASDRRQRCEGADDEIRCVACEASWYDDDAAKTARRVEGGWNRRVAKLPAADDMRRAGFRQAIADHVRADLDAARALFEAEGRPLPGWLQVTVPSAEAST